MRKYGKYEKRPDRTRVPEAKSALLQTYFTSLVCLVLCVSMFFGTSFAWFTSEVNNTGNEIYIGTLDVNVFKRQSADVHLDLSDADYKFFDSNIRWEPGYTALETIEIQNAGDLAFKYVLSFTDGALTEGNKLPIETVAGFFDVWVHEGTPTPASYADITEANDWIPAGTLAEILAGKSVLEGVMEETDVRIQKETQPAAGEAAEAADEESSTEAATEAPTEPASGINPTTHTYTIALHMNEAADASVMGHKISLNVKLVAYQLTSEKDGFGTGAFDQGIVLVSTEKQLVDALNEGGKILLTEDITLEHDITIEKNVSIDLNGHELVSDYVTITADNVSISNGEWEIKPETQMNPDFSLLKLPVAVSGNLILSNVDVSCEKSFYSHDQGDSAEVVAVVVKNGGHLTMKESSIVASNKESKTWSYAYCVSLEGDSTFIMKGGALSATAVSNTEHSYAIYANGGNAKASLESVTISDVYYLAGVKDADLEITLKGVDTNTEKLDGNVVLNVNEG